MEVGVELPFSQHSVSHLMTAHLPQAFTEPQRVGSACARRPFLSPALPIGSELPSFSLQLPTHPSEPEHPSFFPFCALFVPQALLYWPVLGGCYFLRYPFVLICQTKDLGVLMDEFGNKVGPPSVHPKAGRMANGLPVSMWPAGESQCLCQGVVMWSNGTTHGDSVATRTLHR